MEKENNYKLIILIFIPFIFDFLINHYVSLLMLYSSTIFIWQLVFLIFWFWTGKKFSSMKLNKFFSFIIGNSLWILQFSLYIWQFCSTSDAKRNISIAVFSQLYMNTFVPLSTRLVGLFTNTIHGTTVALTAYIFMFITFTSGFLYGRIKNKKLHINTTM